MAVFNENNKKVFAKLKQATTRVDNVCADHEEQKVKYDKLFASNEAAVILHEEVRVIFKHEAQTFFEDRIKWKTDAKHKIDLQDIKME